MSCDLRLSFLRRLARGKLERERFVNSHLAKTIAFQIRAMRELRELSQDDLASRIQSSQNGVSRIESPDYGKTSLSTLKKVAAAFDVALIVRFVPFDELVDWVTSQPRMISGLSPETLAVSAYVSDDVRSPLTSLQELHQERSIAASTGDTNLDTASEGLMTNSVATSMHDCCRPKPPRTAVDMASGGQHRSDTQGQNRSLARAVSTGRQQVRRNLTACGLGSGAAI